MINKTKWKNEAQFSRKVVETLKKRGYLVYKLEPGVGGTTGLPDLMIITKTGVVRYIELKCLERKRFLDQSKHLKDRFGFHGLQILRFREMNKHRKDVWMFIANKKDTKMSALRYSKIGKDAIVTSSNWDYILKKMDY